MSHSLDAQSGAAGWPTAARGAKLAHRRQSGAFSTWPPLAHSSPWAATAAAAVAAIGAPGRARALQSIERHLGPREMQNCRRLGGARFSRGHGSQRGGGRRKCSSLDRSEERRSPNSPILVRRAADLAPSKQVIIRELSNRRASPRIMKLTLGGGAAIVAATLAPATLTTQRTLFPRPARPTKLPAQTRKSARIGRARR